MRATAKNAPPALSRHCFLRRAAAAATALAAPAVVPGAALGLDGRPAPSERATLAMSGCGNQGWNDIHAFLGDDRVQGIAVCDVNFCWDPQEERIPDNPDAARMLSNPHRAPWRL